MKFRLLKADEIDLRVGQVISGKASGYTLLLYKNARCDMAILDETVGEDNWQRRHYEVKGNMYCSVGIRCGHEDGSCEWVYKDDCGVESNTEKEKGEASDSFKRACTNWGIGRELYTSPFVFIPCTLENGKLPNDEKYRRFSVGVIEYNDNRQITALSVVDDKTGEVVFEFPRKKSKATKKSTASDDKVDTTIDNTGKSAGEYIFTKGKYAGRKSVSQVYEDNAGYLEWALTSYLPESDKKACQDYLDLMRGI